MWWNGRPWIDLIELPSIHDPIWDHHHHHHIFLCSIYARSKVSSTATSALLTSSRIKVKYVHADIAISPFKSMQRPFLSFFEPTIDDGFRY